MRSQILIVDDNPENLHVLGKVLEDAGYDIRAAKNGTQALASIDADEPDLVLLDVHMPDVDGFAVCKMIKENPRHTNLPVIFLSALGDTFNKIQGFDAGAIDYVTKPFDADEIQARVETHLTLRRTQDQLARSNEDLRKLQIMRENLVHMIVHDMKTPLFALNTSMGFLKEDLERHLDDKARETLENALNVGTELMQMVDELLDINRLEERKMPVELAECDLAELIQSAVDSVKGIASDRVVNIDANALSKTTCDAKLIRRVIENLVGNAMIHTPANESLDISLDDEDGNVRVSVRDRGSGIPEEVRETIFEKFVIAKTRISGDYHTTGLGLAFCKLAVETHNGRIGVDSEVGKGSTFWFTLPRS